MKKGIFILLFTLITISVNAQKSYWKLKFNNGTYYLALFKSHAKFGPHIRTYFTGDHTARLYAVKYYPKSRKYKVQTKNGWSNKNYLYFTKNGKLKFIRTKGTIELKKIYRSDIPSYIRNDTYYPRKYIKDY